MTAPPIPVPRYGEAALADLVPSLLNALGVPHCANPLGVAPAAHVCLLVVDGLGWHLLRDHAAEAPFLATLAARSAPLTAGFPSTTAVSLSSIGTGLPPGEHGIVGYTMAVPGYEHALNALTWASYAPGSGPGDNLIAVLPPEHIQPQVTAFERAARDDVAVTVIGPAAHAQSGLTRAVFRGGQYRPAYSTGDLVTETLRALDGGDRSFVYAYHPDLDLTGHARGVASDAWRLHLANVDRLAAILAERLPSGALLVIIGDHGMVDLGREDYVDLDDMPTLASGVRLLAGEPRARHVYTKPGAEADVLAAWHTILGSWMWIVSRNEAIAAGWFEPRVLDRVRPRIGDIIAAAHGRVGIVQRSVAPREAQMVGHHGSLTPEEQLAPFLQVFR